MAAMRESAKDSQEEKRSLPVRELPLSPVESARVEPTVEPPAVPDDRQPPRRGRLPEVAEGAPVADATPSPETVKPAPPRDAQERREV